MVCRGVLGSTLRPCLEALEAAGKQSPGGWEGADVTVSSQKIDTKDKVTYGISLFLTRRQGKKRVHTK